MASQKSSKTDLLVRVRYQNPLPAPPFPPKLLHIGTTPHRYATYDFLAPIQGERELPMILDAELGMPLEFGKSADGGVHMGGDYWLGNRSAIASTGDLPTLDEDDQFLTGDADPRGAAGPSNGTNGPGTPGRTALTDVSKKVDVSWLRKTEYLSSEATNMRQALQSLNGNVKAEMQEIDPADRDGRAAAIAATFDAAHIPLSELRHPTKRGVTAVESFDLLPDADLWANEYDLVRFGEDPANRGKDDLPRLGPDPRLPRAIFRDLSAVMPEGEGRVAYYLPIDDEAAQSYTEKRYSAAETAEGEAFDFQYVREYEITGMRPLTQEFVFSFDAGEEATEGEARVKPLTTASRRKGVYYTPIETARQLRKRRPKRGGEKRVLLDGETYWDGIHISLGRPEEGPEEHLENWQALKREVEEPPVRGGGGGARADSVGEATGAEAENGAAREGSVGVVAQVLGGMQEDAAAVAAGEP
ncbi:hypothetical protein BMF94_4827 [Rhodotorula taiwanensis]|uniref:Uncharacterized protein n=1 Tax=Rhodotorula taiwanensis TaxID=741276 RepID=A0A2S5B5Y0_9BASI|nr:hypothetical protein BMF94_4827 [Rhodotorula taiwanensis]